METRSQRQAKNFKGGTYNITKLITGEGRSETVETVHGKKNAIARRNQLQNIAYKVAEANGLKLSKATYYWAINTNTGTVV